MELENEIKILRELIGNTKEDSELLINGLNNKFLSEKSFRKLFDKKSVPDSSDFSYYKINLNKNYVRILNDILDEEGDQFISEITHFAIKSKDKFSAISYDGLSSLYVNRSLFKSDLNTLTECNDDDIFIEFQNKLDDNDFFNWKE